jgi:hypothetical protein
MRSPDVSRENVETPVAGGHAIPVPGELVYGYEPRITRVVEYGASADALFGGQLPPPEGARVDFHLEGPVRGPKLQGTFQGVDYLTFRSDGQVQLHIHAEITTDDGKKIALAAGGLAIAQPGSSVFSLRENVTLLTNHPELSWVNTIQIWASGTVDVSSGKVQVTGYAV